MKTTLKIRSILLFALLIGMTCSYAQKMTHPGGWLTQRELAHIRDNVSDRQEPWYGAWLNMRNKGADKNYSASVTSTITNKSIFQADGHAAYTLAIKWVASGDKAFATTAINIINDWVNKVNGFNHDNTPLRHGIASNKMANAAEILAHGFNGESGWSSSQIDKAKRWFRRVVYPITSRGGSRSMNWGTACVAGNMSMAVFLDNREMFNDAVDAYKNGFSNTNDGCAGVKQYIINSAGQCFESQRDQGHTQGGIAHLVEPALIAWNQGVDLVSYSNNRLVAGMEYTAKYNLGNNVPWTNNIPNPCNISFGWMNNGRISSDGRGNFSPIYVMASYLFTRAGKAHPYTAEVITNSKYHQPERDNSDHPGLGTLTHTLGPIVTMRKRNALKFGLDGGKGGSNGQSVKLYSEKNTNVNQQWIEIDRGRGYYSYQKIGTKYCLDGGNGGRNGNDVKLWTCSKNQQNQHWKKISKGGIFYRLEKRNSSNFSIDGGNGGSNKQNVKLWSNGNGNNHNQQWAFNNQSLKTSAQNADTVQLEEEFNGFSIYPNPVKSELTIGFNDNYDPETSITLYNVNGQKVIKTKPNGEKVRLNLSKLDSGIYVLKINNKSKSLTKKIVKL